MALVRYYYFDSLRAVLMTLGIVLHAAAPYRLDSRWLVVDPAPAAGFAELTWLVHLFRMPAFFVVSGFFSMMVLRRAGPRQFMINRLRRIGLPLATVALTLNFLQALLLDASGSRHWLSFYVDGGWLSHLWFLVDLLAFSLVAAVLFRFISSLSFPGPTLLLLPLISFCFHATASLLLGKHTLVAGVDLHAILTNAPFFLFGLALFPNSIGRRSLPWIGFLFVVAAGLHFVKHRAAELIGHSALVWSTTLLCLYSGKLVLDRDSKVGRYFAEASYTIYLFHHILVVGFALALLVVPLSAYAKFGLIVVAVSFLTVGIHHVLIRPYRVTSLLFNGREFIAQALHEPPVKSVSAQVARNRHRSCEREEGR